MALNISWSSTLETSSNIISISENTGSNQNIISFSDSPGNGWYIRNNNSFAPQYQISGPDEKYFDFNLVNHGNYNYTGELIFKPDPDFETKDEYSVTVQATRALRNGVGKRGKAQKRSFSDQEDFVIKIVDV